MIRGIAFDLEGTAVDVERAHHDARLQAAREVGVEITFEEAISKIPGFVGGSWEEVAQSIWRLSDGCRDPGEIFELIKVHFQRRLATIRGDITRPGFRTFVHEARDLGLSVAIGSSTPFWQAQRLLAMSRLSEIFDGSHIVLGDDVVKRKPDPEVYRLTAQRMGIPTNEQIVFDDSPHGIRAAVSAGSVAYGTPVYTNPHLFSMLLEAGAEEIFLDWGEIDLLELIQSHQ